MGLISSGASAPLKAQKPVKPSDFSAAKATLDGSDIDVTAGSNAGGTIAITANEIVLTGVLQASGKGSGRGGNIDLTVSGNTPIDLSDTLVIARGGNDGPGGHAFVEGGDSIGVTDFHGCISLNGVTCLHFSVDPVELFPMMFEHLQTNSHNPELEHALQFCPSMNGYMDQAINFGIRP